MDCPYCAQTMYQTDSEGQLLWYCGACDHWEALDCECKGCINAKHDAILAGQIISIEVRDGEILLGAKLKCLADVYTLLERVKSAAFIAGLKVDPEEFDVACPEEFPMMLRNCAESFRQSQCELQSAWQDRNAGRVWREFAKALDRAAISCDKAIERYV